MRLVLYQPEIAQNAGAGIRAAACFGAGVDIIEPCGFPPDAKGLKRAAMDYAPSPRRRFILPGGRFRKAPSVGRGG